MLRDQIARCSFEGTEWSFQFTPLHKFAELFQVTRVRLHRIEMVFDTKSQKVSRGPTVHTSGTACPVAILLERIRVVKQILHFHEFF